MKRKILIADDLHPAFKQAAESLGFEVDDRPTIDRAETLGIIKDYVGLAIRTKFRVDKELIDAAINLRFVARAGAGLDNIAEAAAKERNIQLINAPEGNRDAVAEHAIGMLLALMNNLNKGQSQIASGTWDREANRGWELKGKTVAIIGYGFMGQALAKKLSGFEVNMIAYDKYKTGFSDQFVTEVAMEQVVKQADVVSLHIPLTAETKGLVNDEYFFHFKKPIFFINTARGEIVNTQAVITAIREGKLLGAGLDVLETERFPNLAMQSWYDELTTDPRIIVTPHVAGWTFDSYRKISEVLAEKLKDLQI